MKKYLRVLILLTIIFSTTACHKDAKRFNPKTMVNPELIGTWESMDGCHLELMNQNNSLLLREFYTSKNVSLKNIKLQFKLYSIATELSNLNPHDPKFSAKYIDGSILIDSKCKYPLYKTE